MKLRSLVTQASQNNERAAPQIDTANLNYDQRIGMKL